MEVSIVFSDISQIKELGEINSPSFFYYDTGTLKGKKKGWVLKSHWGAKLDPFVIITEDGKPIKAFYSENDPNVIKSLKDYLNEHGN